MLDRITIVQLEMRLIPVASRIAIKITLSSLSHNAGLKKELYKPAHYETRKKLHMTLQGEIKSDPSSNWKNPNRSISLRAAAKFPAKTRTNHRQQGRGRARGRSNANNSFSSTRNRSFRGQQNNRQENNKRKASRMKLCFSCMRPGHQNKDCPSRRQGQQNPRDNNQRDN